MIKLHNPIDNKRQVNINLLLNFTRESIQVNHIRIVWHLLLRLLLSVNKQFISDAFFYFKKSSQSLTGLFLQKVIKLHMKLSIYT